MGRLGKTELAKTVADVYFGAETNMIRIDMSEYQEKRSLDRLIGSAHEKGLLTEAVRNAPFSLVLFDELEKAHPDILNVFLQMMDDGRLTDGTGRTIDFTNAIIIATSNAGTGFIQDELRKGVSMEEIRTTLVNEKLRDQFRPEFLNRFDSIVVFSPLSREEIVAITKLEIQKAARRLEQKGIHLIASEEAVNELAEQGYDPTLGARPIRRLIQDHLESSLARFLLSNSIGRRDIAILEPGGKIQVERAQKLG
ncbi:MAG: ATP-dependent Clp protease ATP-binding subunit [Candidatus Kerfeldbacteria bacterium]|nr:ATP-dependent Clp protease ATP-binding subunit [Candidatus Kerfeldbacteria bacterium]